MGYTIEQLVSEVPPNTEERVQYVRREFSKKIHSVLRTETGFRLSSQGRQAGTTKRTISVPVEILPGVPEELKNIRVPDEQEGPLRLAPWRRHLEHFVNSGGLISRDLLPTLEEDLLQGRQEAFPISLELAIELLEEAKKSRLIEIIFSREQTYLTDYLGVYWHNFEPAASGNSMDERINSKIILYWGVIGLVADDLNVSVEGMALKVLAHEWGHAYSHVALDIDGQHWGSSGFRQTDSYVKEGIAQYCALKVIDELEHRIPEAKEAYEKLYPRQPEPYRAHLKWLQFKPEEIRQAMLLARRSGKSTIDQFEETLSEAKNLLRK